MSDLRKLRSDLKYVIEKLEYDEVDVIDTEEYMNILLGKTKVKDAVYFTIVSILNNRPTDFEDSSIGAYGTVYGHKDNLKIAKEIAETDKRMAEILENYIL